jgi:hypothetical protein
MQFSDNGTSTKKETTKGWFPMLKAAQVGFIMTGP